MQNLAVQASVKSTECLSNQQSHKQERQSRRDQPWRRLATVNKIAQKVCEEAVELVIEAMDDNEELFLEEAADLMFHYLLLLNAKGYNLQSVIDVLRKRHAK